METEGHFDPDIFIDQTLLMGDSDNSRTKFTTSSLGGGGDRGDGDSTNDGSEYDWSDDEEKEWTEEESTRLWDDELEELEEDAVCRC